MSQETMEWLNTMTRIGDTDRRGMAWHARKGATNHYPGAIPTEDVRELFRPFEPITVPLYYGVENPEDGDVSVSSENLLTSHQAIVPVSDPRTILSVVGSDYVAHGYEEWLADTLSNLVDGDVHFSSAGLLEKGAVGWAELSVDENRRAADFEFKPQILAFTSVNGRYATTFKNTVQAVVCDNTLRMAARENGEQVKVKHTKNSRFKLQSARDALGIIIGTGDAMVAEIESLATRKVSGEEWNKILQELIPTKGKEGAELTPAAVTKATNLQEKLGDLWAHDERVAPWKGTALGVVQAFNTYAHHVKPVRTRDGVQTIRPARNMASVMDGTLDRETRTVLDAIDKVLI